MILSKKDILLDRFATCRNNLSWFPPLQTAVNGLNQRKLVGILTTLRILFGS